MCRGGWCTTAVARRARKTQTVARISACRICLMIDELSLSTIGAAKLQLAVLSCWNACTPLLLQVIVEMRNHYGMAYACSPADP